MIPYTPFGLRVAQTLDARAESFKSLARAVETDYVHMWKVLHGRRPSKSLEHRIADYLGWGEESNGQSCTHQ